MVLSYRRVCIVTIQEAPEFRHEALPYKSSELLLEQVASFLGPALDREEPVLIAARSDTLSGFRTELVGHRTHIDLAPMEEVGRNPGRLISVWSDFLDRHGAEGRTVWGIGEPIYTGRDPLEIEESELYEQLVNGAFTEPEFTLHLGCPYDTASLPSDVVDDLVLSHPFIGSGAESQANARFLADGHAERKLSPALIRDDAFSPFTKDSLGEMRKELAETARRFGVEEDRIPTSCWPSTRSPPTASSTRAPVPWVFGRRADVWSAKFETSATSRIHWWGDVDPKPPRSEDEGSGLPTRSPI